MSRARKTMMLILGALLFMLVQGLQGPVRSQDDYSDPWGLPSGSATLKLASQLDIASGAAVQGFDFAAGSVDSMHGYLEIVAAGEADLIYFELHPDSSRYFFRAPEDPELFDRELIASLADSVGLEEIAHMQEIWLKRFVPIELGHAFVLIQERTDGGAELSAVKLEVTALADSSVSFDWVWQPNGSLEFIPSSSRETSLSALKALFGF